MKKTIHTTTIAIMTSIILITHYSEARQRRISTQPTLRKPTKADNILQATKQLQEIQKEAKNDKTLAEKKESSKKIIEATNYLLATITEERSTLDDFRGYDPDQIIVAESQLAKLRIQQKEIEALLKKARRKVEIFDDANMTGSERQRAAKKVSMLEEILNRINASIQDQEIITGKRYSNAVRLALGVIGTGTVLTAGYYLGLGGVASTLYQNPRQAMSDAWKSVKTTLTTAPSWLGGGETAKMSAWDIIKGAHQITIATIGTIGTFLTAWNYYKQLNELIKTMTDDPNADPKLLEESIKERNQLAQKIKKFKENNPEEYKKAMSQVKQ